MQLTKLSAITIILLSLLACSRYDYAFDPCVTIDGVNRAYGPILDRLENDTLKIEELPAEVLVASSTIKNANLSVPLNEELVPALHTRYHTSGGPIERRPYWRDAPASDGLFQGSDIELSENGIMRGWTVQDGNKFDAMLFKRYIGLEDDKIQLVSVVVENEPAIAKMCGR